MNIVTEAHLEPYRSLWGENRGPLVDTGLDILGRVYIAENEAHDILVLFPDLVGKLAAELGWLSPEDTAALCAGTEQAIAERDAEIANRIHVVPVSEIVELQKIQVPQHPKAAA